MTSRTHAFITPSYPGDLARFRLQCESMDAMAQGDWRHYVLIADHDYEVFKEFEGPRRQVITDSVLLPKWLKPVRRPFNKAGNWMWIRTNFGLPLWPMSGWHVQQFRKMLIARHIDEENMVMVDSDSFFIRPFNVEKFKTNGFLRLYRKQSAIVDTENYAEHVKWVKQSSSILGIELEKLPATDYIGNLVTWRRDYALAMIDHIENHNGSDLVSIMGRHRTFSEYQIYGSFVERVLQSPRQPGDAAELTCTHWGAGALLSQSIEAFMANLSDEQIAIGVQSFTVTSVDLLRETYLGMTRKLR
jgi:Family of unknown function (DUF6492)